jgi:hypothetical protein
MAKEDKEYPGLYLLLLQILYIIELFEKCIKLVDNIENIIGGDFLLFLKELFKINKDDTDNHGN